MGSHHSSHEDELSGSEPVEGQPAGSRAAAPPKPHVQNRWINPLIIRLLQAGLAPPTYALLETTGRRSGRRRPVPVANGLDGDTFWLIAGLGQRADHVRNLREQPRVRVCASPGRIRDGLRMRWRWGTAHPMSDDDAEARHRRLGHGRPAYQADGVVLRSLAGGGRMLTVRIDLDRDEPRESGAVEQG